MRLLYRDVPSNPVELETADAAPGIFTTFTGGSDALVLNQDGSINGPANPARAREHRRAVRDGMRTDVAAERYGGARGHAAGRPGRRGEREHGGRPAEILYAGPAPTLVGVTQVNARVPEEIGEGRASVELRVDEAPAAPACCSG